MCELLSKFSACLWFEVTNHFILLSLDQFFQFIRSFVCFNYVFAFVYPIWLWTFMVLWMKMTIMNINIDDLIRWNSNWPNIYLNQPLNEFAFEENCETSFFSGAPWHNILIERSSIFKMTHLNFVLFYRNIDMHDEDKPLSKSCTQLNSVVMAYINQIVQLYHECQLGVVNIS